MVTEAFPILTVRELEDALRLYRDVLGGDEMYRFPEGGDPVFMTLRIGGATLGLGVDPARTAPDRERAHRDIALCLYVEDCDAAVERLRGDVEVVDEPEDQPYGERMARVVDGDGHGLVLLSTL